MKTKTEQEFLDEIQTAIDSAEKENSLGCFGIEFKIELKFWALSPCLNVNLNSKEIELEWLCFGLYFNWEQIKKQFTLEKRDFSTLDFDLNTEGERNYVGTKTERIDSRRENLLPDFEHFSDPPEKPTSNY